MRHYWDRYLVPTSVEETLAVLADYEGKAPLLAGGTDLMIDLMNDTKQVPAVIDITRIPGMDEVRVDDGELVIGACATLSDVANSSAVQRSFPHLVEAIKTIGSVQIRNVATVVGNVANASPAADCVPPLLIEDCRVAIVGREGEREVKLETFLLGPRQIACEKDEVIVALHVPLPGEWAAAKFEKLGLRRAMAIAVVNVAVSVSMRNGEVEKASIALGSVAPTAVRARQAEASLIGGTLDEASLNEASELAVQAASPIDDFRASANYRRKMVQALTLRCLQKAQGQLIENGPG
jgi:carbon-monoxide dehydrogenase medium subunit